MSCDFYYERTKRSSMIPCMKMWRNKIRTLLRYICIAWEVITTSSVEGFVAKYCICHFVIVDNDTPVPVLQFVQWSVKHEDPNPSKLRRRNLKTEYLHWERIKCFSSTLCSANLKRKQFPVISVSWLRKLEQGYRSVIVMSPTLKSSFSKWFSSTLKRKVGPGFQNSSVLRRVSISSWWLSVDDRPNHRNKAAFNFLWCSLEVT